MAVIGGGLSGLAAAHRLIELCRAAKRPLDLTLFEAGDRLGGVVETRRRDGYLVETGADSFITDKPWAVELCHRLGLEDRLIPTEVSFRRSLVLFGGRPVPVPAGFNLLAPTRLLPVLCSPLFSPWGKLRMGLECFVPRRRDGGDESLASFVRRRLGREAFERLVQPLVGGIYTADPETLSLQATLPRFREMERRHGSLIRALRNDRRAGGFNPPALRASSAASGARYGLFATLAGGLSELVEALRRRVEESATIRLDTPVIGLTRDEGRRRTRCGETPGHGDLRVTVSPRPSSPIPPPSSVRSDEGRGTRGEGGTVLPHSFSHPSSLVPRPSVDAVVLALPAYTAADLLDAFDPTLAEKLREIDYASSAIVVTGHRVADVKHPLDAFGLVIGASEQRKILAVSFASRKFPGRAPERHVLLRTFVGGALQPELLERSDADLVALVRAELAELLGVTGNADFAIVSRYDRAMPQYHVGHVDRVTEIEQRVQAHPSLVLAGNAYHGVGIPDCIHSGEQAAERLFAASQ